MILGPGESVTIRIPIGDAKSGVDPNGQWSFEEVPPPAAAPVQDEAERLGLPPGLRVNNSLGGQWRCSECSKMQRAGSTMVWVPDGVQKNDPVWSVIESARQNAWNGHASGWCLHCCRQWIERPAKPVLIADQTAPVLGFWDSVRAFLGFGK